MSKFNSALVCTVLYPIQRIAAHIKNLFSSERVKPLGMAIYHSNDALLIGQYLFISLEKIA